MRASTSSSVCGSVMQPLSATGPRLPSRRRPTTQIFFVAMPQEPLFVDTEVLAPGAKGRRVQGGEARSDVVMSAHIGGNAEIFPQILALHVPQGSLIADV